MVRGLSVFLGVGLILVWLAGITSPIVPSWLAWADLILGIAAFVFAGTINSASLKRRLAGGPFLFSAALFILWAVSLGTPTQVSWITWWNFAFALAFLLVGVGATLQKAPIIRHPAAPYATRELEELQEEEEKQRRIG